MSLITLLTLKNKIEKLKKEFGNYSNTEALIMYSLSFIFFISIILGSVFIMISVMEKNLLMTLFSFVLVLSSLCGSLMAYFKFDKFFNKKESLEFKELSSMLEGIVKFDRKKLIKKSLSSLNEKETELLKEIAINPNKKNTYLLTYIEEEISNKIEKEDFGQYNEKEISNILSLIDNEKEKVFILEKNRNTNNILNKSIIQI